jgi:hypothetical protein
MNDGRGMAGSVRTHRSSSVADMAAVAAEGLQAGEQQEVLQLQQSHPHTIPPPHRLVRCRERQAAADSS